MTARRAKSARNIANTKKAEGGRSAVNSKRKTETRDAAAEDLRTALRARSGVKARPEPVLLIPEAMTLPKKGRSDLKGVVIYLNEAAKDQLARLSIDQRRTVQDLGVEAVNLLFRRYREKPIA